MFSLRVCASDLLMRGAREQITCTNTNSLFRPKASFALLVVGSDALFSVLALEAVLLQFAFEGETFGEGLFGAGLDSALDTPDRLRGFVGRAEALRVLHNLLPVALWLVDVVDEAEVERLLEAEQLALGHQFDGLVFWQGASHALRATGAGQHAEGDFRQANLACVALSDADIAGQGDFQPAADGVAVQGGDYQLGRLLQPRQRLVGVQAEVVF